MKIKNFFKSPSRIVLTLIALFWLATIVVVTYQAVFTSYVFLVFYVHIFFFPIMVAIPFVPLECNTWAKIVTGFKVAFIDIGMLYWLGESEWQKRRSFK